MILDSDGSTCHTVNALIDTDTTATRSWTIHVSQYTCQNEYSGGPPGCLQYHYNSNLATTVSGAISNFGFDRSLTTVGVTGECYVTLIHYLFYQFFKTGHITHFCLKPNLYAVGRHPDMKQT